MIRFLNRLDKKFLFIIGLFIGLPILIIIFLAVIQGCGDKKISPEKYEEKMVSAAEEYVEDMENIPTEEGELLEIQLTTLVDKGYIKSPKKLLDDSSCNGTVSVRRNGASIEETEGGYLNYIANLNCSEYKTLTLVDKIKEQLVTENDGLYQDGDSYIFRGKNVDNYFELLGAEYRIMSIDANGILKLVKSIEETSNRAFDNKYNTELGNYSGKNIYKDSLLLEYLVKDYNNDKKFSEEARQYIMAYDVCIGTRSENDFAIDSLKDCSQILEKQVVSLANISDYAKASLDVDCTTLNTAACNNYNYLKGVISSTWTMNASADNSYSVLYLSSGMMKVNTANKYNSYNIVIYVDGNQTYVEGLGTEKEPYVLVKK